MATKTLTYENRDDSGNLADLDASPTFSDEAATYGVRRSDTLAVQTAAGVAWTHTGTGVYTADLTGLESGVQYEYVVRTVASGEVAYEGGTFVTTTSHYPLASGLRLELGTDNTNLWADLDNDGGAASIAAVIDSAQAQADVRVNLKLGAYSPPPATVPVTSTEQWVTDAITMAATKYAAGYLLNRRDRQAAGTAVAQGTLSSGDLLIRDGDELLQMLIDAGLPGVTLDDEDETLPAGSFEFVPITRTVCDASTDENYRPPLWYGSN